MFKASIVVVLSQVKEFKYLRVLIKIQGKIEWEMDRIGAAFAVMRALYRSVVVKRFRFTGLWVETKRTRS